MSPENFRGELEWDLDRRKKEMVVFTNLLNNMPNQDKEIYCKALLVMLYSHFEGFCRYAFLTYLRFINDEKIKRSSAKESLIASSLMDVFHDLKYVNNGRYCCDAFNITSDETQFSRFFVRAHFIRKFEDILSEEVNISGEMPGKIVDTKSNLWPNVFSTILYRLGLPHNEFDNYTSVICNMLHRRNAYAHGIEVDGIKEDEFRTIEGKIYAIFSDLITLLTKSAKNKSYLKLSPPTPSSRSESEKEGVDVDWNFIFFCPNS